MKNMKEGGVLLLVAHDPSSATTRERERERERREAAAMVAAPPWLALADRPSPQPPVRPRSTVFVAFSVDPEAASRCQIHHSHASPILYYKFEVNLSQEANKGRVKEFKFAMTACRLGSVRVR